MASRPARSTSWCTDSLSQLNRALETQNRKPVISDPRAEWVQRARRRSACYSCRVPMMVQTTRAGDPFQCREEQERGKHGTDP